LVCFFEESKGKNKFWTELDFESVF